MNTEAIAREIVDLRNKLRTLEEGGKAETERARRIRERMGLLQAEIAGDPPQQTESDTQADKIQFIPPT